MSDTSRDIIEDQNKSKDSANKRCLQKLEYANDDLEKANKQVKELEKKIKDLEQTNEQLLKHP